MSLWLDEVEVAHQGLMSVLSEEAGAAALAKDEFEGASVWARSAVELYDSDLSYDRFINAGVQAQPRASYNPSAVSLDSEGSASKSPALTRV